jgi:hypothetical protein
VSKTIKYNIMVLINTSAKMIPPLYMILFAINNKNIKKGVDSRVGWW